MKALITFKRMAIICLLLSLSFLFCNEGVGKEFPKKFQKKGIKHGQWKPEGRKEGRPYTVALKEGSFQYEKFRNEVGEKLISKSNELQFTPFKKLLIR